MEGLSVLGLGPYLSILVAAALTTHMWRWLGVALSGRLTEDSEFFDFLKAIASALVAAVIAKLLLDSAGPLAEVPLWAKLAATGVGVAGFFLGGRRLLAGIAAAQLAIAAVWFALIG